MSDRETAEERFQRLGLTLFRLLPSLAVALRHRTGASAEMAEEIADQAFVRVLAMIRDSKLDPLMLEDPGALKAYAAKVVLSLHQSLYRRAKVVERSRSEVLRFLGGKLAGAGVASELIKQEELGRLKRAVKATREPYQTLLEALLNDDVTLAEYAARHKIPLGTIYTQFHRAIHALRQEFFREE